MAGKFSKNRQGFVDPHVEHVGDRPAAIMNFQRLAVEPGSAAHRARHGQVGQEIHLDLPHALPLAFFAAAPLGVEAEAARCDSRAAGLRACRQTPCGSRRTRRCRWPDCSAACGRSATGRSRSACRCGSRPAGCDAGPASAATCPAAGPAPGQRLVDQRALARSADARHAHQHAQRKSRRSTSLRLFVVTPSSVIEWVLAMRRRAAGTGIRSSPAQIAAGDRTADRRPLRPAFPGRRSARRAARRRARCRSADRPAASSPRRARRPAPCCPAACRLRRASISRWLSRGCRPIDGSSST